MPEILNWKWRMNKLRQLLSNLRSSFWFKPSLMVTGSIVQDTALVSLALAYPRETLATRSVSCAARVKA
ncbi:MAG: DUF2254 domain-containing protein [Woeseiaceae bacterium]|nr:DUF2254 domain-containing protein [Woeseiaceae bacterium]